MSIISALVETLSLDEAFLDACGPVHCRGATPIAEEIRARNKTGRHYCLCWFASDKRIGGWNKPHDLLVITLEAVDHFVGQLSVRKTVALARPQLPGRIQCANL